MSAGLCSGTVCADAKRWRHFAVASSRPFFDLPQPWQDFFYALGDGPLPPEAVTTLIDACITSDPLI